MCPVAEMPPNASSWPAAKTEVQRDGGVKLRADEKHPYLQDGHLEGQACIPRRTHTIRVA